VRKSAVDVVSGPPCPGINGTTWRKTYAGTGLFQKRSGRSNWPLGSCPNSESAQFFQLDGCDAHMGLRGGDSAWWSGGGSVDVICNPSRESAQQAAVPPRGEGKGWSAPPLAHQPSWDWPVAIVCCAPQRRLGLPVRYRECPRNCASRRGALSVQALYDSRSHTRGR
jgi:hypothetical protein